MITAIKCVFRHSMQEKNTILFLTSVSKCVFFQGLVEAPLHQHSRVTSNDGTYSLLTNFSVMYDKCIIMYDKKLYNNKY